MSEIKNGGVRYGLPAALNPAGIYREWLRSLRYILSHWLFVSLLVMMFVVIAQLVYPANRTLPGVSFAGYRLNSVTKEQAAAILADLTSKPVSIAAVNKHYSTSLGSIGISYDTEKIAAQLSEYPLAKRLTPFSIFFHRPQVSDNGVLVDHQKLQIFTEQVARENNREAVEGSITINGSIPVITPPTNGVRYDALSISSYFEAASGETLAGDIKLPYSSSPPINTFTYLESLADQAEAISKRQLKVVTSSGDVEIASSAIAGAIKFKTNASSGLIELDFDPKILATTLEDLADKVFLAPTSQQAPGRELDFDATAEAMRIALNSSANTFEAAFKPLSYSGSKLYPQTSKGLGQLITDWEAAHSSLGLAVEFSEIGGMGRKASLKSSDKYFSASVYKAFVAWYVLKGIDEGRINESQVIAGWNLDSCFYDMIIVSASICAEGVVNAYGGWGVMDGFIARAGIEGISLSQGVSISAHGMTQFLTKLESGEILSKQGTETLLSYLKRQKYRQAIPAGSAGEVADKVGYNPKTYSWHDAAIVYHPKTKYTLVFLTESGASLYTLSDLARQVSDTLNR